MCNRGSVWNHLSSDHDAIGHLLLIGCHNFDHVGTNFGHFFSRFLRVRFSCRLFRSRESNGGN